ncbi:unnamed protein product [Mytilus coruscus]|uniref:Uncharacterized protein n=1 Tax=Mytilus coruscus TaxID=42192 RepID=A0A6J8D1J1_MYTCO|nr:unnamed protein product [Mytilus coruscus]
MFLSRASKQPRLYRMTFGVRMYLSYQHSTPNKYQNPTSDTLVETPKTSTREKRYPLGQATSDSKGSSTPRFTYSPDLPSERKVHIPATPKTGLSSSESPRVGNTHPVRRDLEFCETPLEEQGTQPNTNTLPLIISPTELNSQRKCSRASRPPAWHSDYNMD